MLQVKSQNTSQIQQNIYYHYGHNKETFGFYKWLYQHRNLLSDEQQSELLLNANCVINSANNNYVFAVKWTCTQCKILYKHRNLLLLDSQLPLYVLLRSLGKKFEVIKTHCCKDYFAAKTQKSIGAYSRKSCLRWELLFVMKFSQCI